MSAPDALERFVVITGNPPDPLQALLLDGLDPTLELENDVTWHAFEILLGPPAQPDRPDHDRIVHHWGVYSELKALMACGIGRQGSHVTCQLGSLWLQRGGAGHS